MLKRSVVIRANRLKKINIRLDYKTIVFFTVLLCGVIFGVMLTNSGSEAWHQFIGSFLNNHLTIKSTSSVFRSFCSVFFSFFILLLFDYACGLCGIGVPFLYLTPLFLGIYCGIITSQLYCSYQLTGLLYCAVVNVPCYAITAATLIKCCCFSSDISREIFIYLVNGKNDTKEKLLQGYTIRYLIMCIPLIISALINAVTFRLLKDLFNLV